MDFWKPLFEEFISVGIQHLATDDFVLVFFPLGSGCIVVNLLEFCGNSLFESTLVKSKGKSTLAEKVGKGWGMPCDNFRN